MKDDITNNILNMVKNGELTPEQARKILKSKKRTFPIYLLTILFLFAVLSITAILILTNHTQKKLKYSSSFEDVTHKHSQSVNETHKNNNQKFPTKQDENTELKNKILGLWVFVTVKSLKGKISEERNIFHFSENYLSMQNIEYENGLIVEGTYRYILKGLTLYVLDCVSEKYETLFTYTHFKNDTLIINYEDDTAYCVRRKLNGQFPYYKNINNKLSMLKSNMRSVQLAVEDFWTYSVYYYPASFDVRPSDLHGKDKISFRNFLASSLKNPFNPDFPPVKIYFSDPPPCSVANPGQVVYVPIKIKDNYAKGYKIYGKGATAFIDFILHN